MDELPSELLVLVLEFSDQPSQKTCRSVNKRFSEASTPLVFRHVYMSCFFRSSLDKFYHLSRSSLAKHVKQFTMYSDMLPYLDETQYREKLTSSIADIEPWEIVDRRLQTMFSEYQTLFSEQQRWRPEREGLVIKESLAMLPKLAEARIQSASSFLERGRNYWPVWKSIWHRTYLGPDDWGYNVRDMRAFHKALKLRLECKLATICFLDAIAFRASFSGVTPVTHLIDQSMPVQAHWMTIQYDDHYGGLFGDPRGLHRYQTINTVFEYLTRIRIYHALGGLEGAWFDLMVPEELTMILRRARRLREVHLDFHDFNDGSIQERCLFPDLFAVEETIWPDLHRLSLSTNVETEALLNFLALHTETLKTLALRDMAVTDVKLLVRKIPEVLQVQNLCLEDLRSLNPPIFQDVQAEQPIADAVEENHEPLSSL